MFGMFGNIRLYLEEPFVVSTLLDRVRFLPDLENRSRWLFFLNLVVFLLRFLSARVSFGRFSADVMNLLVVRSPRTLFCMACV